MTYFRFIVSLKITIFTIHKERFVNHLNLGKAKTNIYNQQYQAVCIASSGLKGKNKNQFYE